LSLGIIAGIVATLLLAVGVVILYKAYRFSKDQDAVPDTQQNGGLTGTYTTSLQSYDANTRTESPVEPASGAVPEPQLPGAPGQAQVAIGLEGAWRHLSRKSKVALSFVTVWILAILVLMAAGPAIDFTYTSPQGQSMATPTPPPKLKIKPHSSKRAKSRAKAKHARQVKTYQQDRQRIARLDKLSHQHHKHIPIWWLVLGFPLLVAVIGLIDTIRTWSLRRRKPATTSD
jgi:hypothetical protein